MKRAGGGELRLGAGVVELLVRQRRPLLMVDFVAAFERQPVPRLRAGRHVTMNEAFFDGHFPDVPIWPGALTMEGLGQSCTILTVLTVLCRTAEAEGHDPGTILDALRNLDRGYRLHPGYRPDDLPPLLDRLRSGDLPLTVGAAVELKFLQPVVPGCRLDYEVAWEETFGDLLRFAVEAAVDGTPVARGTLTGAWTSHSPPTRRESGG